MRRNATLVAAALAAAAWSPSAWAADFIGFAPGASGYTVDPDPARGPPIVDELVDYAITTVDSLPAVGGRIGEVLFTSGASRVVRPMVRDQGRYLSNFRIPPGVTLMRSRAKARAGDETATMAVVPEPATWALMILGFGAVASAQRRRRSVPVGA